jgi:small subunit ribosomal protein S8
MAMNDLLSDTLTRIRNGQKARLFSVDAFYSKLTMSVCDVLQREGFITSYEKTGSEQKPTMNIVLKYFEDKPVISKVKRISKPGRREYAPVQEIKKVNNGLGISVLTTSKGVLSDNEARQQNVGGEVLCEVF